MADIKIDRKELPITSLVPHGQNPNRMAPREFDLLVDNMSMTGWTEPVLVRELGNGKYGIIGGHHRVEAGKYLGYSMAPCTILSGSDVTDELVDFQLLRMNVIHGKLDPQAFFGLYKKYEEQYGQDLLQEMFGFADQAEWKKLIAQTAKSLPTALKDKFKEAAAEIKTIDGLSKLLNHLFTSYGDTLPFGYMFIDYGGQESVWLRMSKPTFDSVKLLGSICLDKQVTMDDLVGSILQAIAKGEASDLVQKALDKAPKVAMPTGFIALPTADNVQKASGL